MCVMAISDLNLDLVSRKIRRYFVFSSEEAESFPILVYRKIKDTTSLDLFVCGLLIRQKIFLFFNYCNARWGVPNF